MGVRGLWLVAWRLCVLGVRVGCVGGVVAVTADLFLSLPGFESQMSGKFLANLRRCERKAGGIELERVFSPTRSDFQAALAIEAAAWKGAAGTSIQTDAHVAHLYEAMTRLFGPSGRACLSFLRARGERIAQLLSVEDERTLYALKIGYDPRHAAVSPGHLIVWKVAADAERRGKVALDFVGREDSWKRKWTDDARRQVSVNIYRRTPRGVALRVLREVVKPSLPERMRDLHTPLRAGCQKGDIVGQHPLGERVSGRIGLGLGIRSGLKRLVRPPPLVPRTGEASRFPPGSWLRVLSADRIRATLDSGGRTRGLAFVPVQWDTCGGTYRVKQPVMRLRDDHGRMRPVTRTVLLEGATCAGSGGDAASVQDAARSAREEKGCGRHCPLMFRDEWLERAEEPAHHPPSAYMGLRAHILDLDEIRAGLDLHGRHQGVTFLPEMAAYAGKRFHVVGKITKVFEYDRWVPTRGALYLLEGLACTGRALEEAGPCDRACALLWHEDWLLLEPDASHPAAPQPE
jgi:hypothetical protein